MLTNSERRHDPNDARAIPAFDNEMLRELLRQADDFLSAIAHGPFAMRMVVEIAQDGDMFSVGCIHKLPVAACEDFQSALCRAGWELRPEHHAGVSVMVVRRMVRP